MKRRICVVLVALILSLLSLASCEGGGGDGGTVNNDNAYIFNENVVPSIVYSSNTPKDAMNLIYNSLKEATGEVPDFYTDIDVEAAGHEIVIGNTGRSISRKAMRKLRTVVRDTDYDVAYLIYVSGNSVAIVYDEHTGDANVASLIAATYFSENYIEGKTELQLNPGVAYSSTYNVLNYLAEQDAAAKAKKWAALALRVDVDAAMAGLEVENLGQSMAEAFQSLYSIYDAKVVTWFANLYDPGVGGYYFSNSARDNIGYLPDIESTAQALGAIGGMGLGDYRSFIPEDMRREIIIYLRGLQDQNGFFYHTQWEKADTDNHLSRRARDLGNATSVLTHLGSRPRFLTPNGVEGGDGPDVIPDSIKELIEQESAGGTVSVPHLDSSVVSSVSKVVLAASYDKRFENLDTLKAYMQEKHDLAMNGGQSFYSIGNELTSQMAQITARDKALETYGTPDSLVGYIIEWFNAEQEAVQEKRREMGLEPNGLWEVESAYLGVNGLLKISGVYNHAKAPMPYPAEAAQAAIDAITSDQVMGAVVDLYNTWFAVGNILSNLENYGGTDGGALAKKIVNDLRAVAPAAIIKSGVKMHDFEKPDGSYSYSRLYSSSHSQGMPVAIPNSVEGDVNGTVIAINGLVGNIYTALRLNDVKVPIFGSREARIYRDILDDLEPVQKITEEPADDFMIDFEDEIDGETPFNVSGGSNAIICEGKNGMYVEFASEKMQSASLVLPNNGVKSNSCYVHKMDICIPSGRSDNSYLYQITMGSCYMYSIQVKNGKPTLVEATTESGSTAIYTDFAALEYDTWYSIRVEYYAGEDDDSVRIKFYLDDKLIAVTNNYYKKVNGSTTNKPAGNASYTSTKVYAMQSPQSVIWVDNVHCYSTKSYYTPATDADTDLVFNIDAGKNFGGTEAE